MMHIDIDELVRLGVIKINDETVVESGVLIDLKNKEVDYRVTYGWDLLSANSCDKDWKVYRFQLADFIEANYSKAEIPSVLSTIQVEDSHWKWVAKSMIYKSDEYKWFYLKTDNRVEAACLVYHPKKSFIDSEDIFYVEFIAVAPWNRDDPMSGKTFKGVGSILLRAVVNHLVTKLGLSYRFGLHALPQASGYYQRIGMDYIPTGDKDSLEYFEMSNNNALKFLGR